MTTRSIIEKIKNDELLHRPDEEFIKSRIVSWAVKQLICCPYNHARQSHIEYILYLTAISKLKYAIEYIEKDEPDMTQFDYKTSRT
jgi:hypothetical protein